MKSKNVHRGVSRLPQFSTDNTVAKVGKLSKIHREYKPTSDLKRKRSRDSSKNLALRNTLNTFLIMGGVILLSIIGWVVYGIVKNRRENAASITLAQETFKVPHPDASQCVHIVEKFLATKNPIDLAALGRIGTVNADAAYEQKSKIAKSEGDIESIQWAGSMEINGLSMETAFITYSSQKQRYVYLLPDANNQWVVDVDSFLLTGSKDWQTVLAKSTVEADTRVIIEQDTYYNGVFVNEKEWGCFKITAPDLPESLFGYVKLNSIQKDALWDILRTNSPARAMIRISRDSGMESKQFEIIKVIAQDWVESDVPFEQRVANPTAKKTDNKPSSTPAS